MRIVRRSPSRRDLQQAAKLAYVGGALMVVSGTVGSTTMLSLGYDLLQAWLPFLDTLFTVALAVALAIAGLGGLAVIGGGLLLHGSRRGAGTTLITLGVGSGLLGLAVHVLLATVDGNDPVIVLLTAGSTLSGLAVLLTIAARLKVSTLTLRVR